jgi:molybdopterin-binding protein
VDPERQAEDGADTGRPSSCGGVYVEAVLAKDKAKPAAMSRERFRRVSGRNQLAGKVVSIRVEGLLAEVVLSVGDTHVTAIITAGAVRELQLKKGDSAAALIKSTDVMIERLDDPS